MNKKNKILVGCLALLLVMSAGYALFSDTITINGTATAKGNFDISATCMDVPSDFPRENYYYILTGDPKIPTDNNYKNESCTVTADDEITVSTELTQPGAAKSYIVELKNNGSIPASLSLETGIDGSIERCEGNLADDTFSNCKTSFEGNTIMSLDLAGAKNTNGENIYFTRDNQEGMLKYINPDDMTVTIQPGESIYFRLFADWEIDNDNHLDDDKDMSVYYKENSTVKFTFNQVTN